MPRTDRCVTCFSLFFLFFMSDSLSVMDNSFWEQNLAKEKQRYIDAQIGRDDDYVVPAEHILLGTASNEMVTVFFLHHLHSYNSLLTTNNFITSYRTPTWYELTTYCLQFRPHRLHQYCLQGSPPHAKGPKKIPPLCTQIISLVATQPQLLQHQ